MQDQNTNQNINQNVIENYMVYELEHTNSPRRLVRTVAEFVNVLTGQTERNITNYIYRDTRHHCDPVCNECLFDRNLHLQMDMGESLDDMTARNGGQLPEDWYNRIPEYQRIFLEGVMNDRNDVQIARRYFRRRSNYLRQCPRCHGECDTDVE